MDMDRQLVATLDSDCFAEEKVVILFSAVTFVLL